MQRRAAASPVSERDTAQGKRGARFSLTLPVDDAPAVGEWYMDLHLARGIEPRPSVRNLVVCINSQSRLFYVEVRQDNAQLETLLPRLHRNVQHLHIVTAAQGNGFKIEPLVFLRDCVQPPIPQR